MFEANCEWQKFDISFILMRFHDDFFNCWCVVAHKTAPDNKSGDVA